MLGTMGWLTMIERVVTALVLPSGACWLALGFSAGLAARRGQRLLACLLAGTWLVYTLAGNGLIAGWLLSRLERPYYAADPLNVQPVDQLVVLGGMVGFLQDGRAQVIRGGDRVVLAARLYHRGQAARLVAAGAAATPAGLDEHSAAAAMMQIWQDLGVPASDIAAIPGRNTSEEIGSVKRMLAEEPDQRVGLLTSAWHLPRAMRLAERAGLDLVPVPADFATGGRPASWQRQLPGLIPSGSGFERTQRALREQLAAFAGR